MLVDEEGRFYIHCKYKSLGCPYTITQRSNETEDEFEKRGGKNTQSHELRYCTLRNSPHATPSNATTIKISTPIMPPLTVDVPSVKAASIVDDPMDVEPLINSPPKTKEELSVKENTQPVPNISTNKPVLTIKIRPPKPPIQFPPTEQLQRPLSAINETPTLPQPPAKQEIITENYKQMKSMLKQFRDELKQLERIKEHLSNSNSTTIVKSNNSTLQ